MLRLPYFLQHYRRLGVKHFLFVDNNSDDGTGDYLTAQPDVSLWTTQHSYRLARFGMDWLGWLHWQYGHGHWCLTVDADELLIYPDCETRTLAVLTAWLQDHEIRSFGALMLDLYPKGPVADSHYASGDDPLKVLNWFDADNYRSQLHKYYGNDWIQGGARERLFFARAPKRAPTLNKTPLVWWHWRNCYVSSTHQILPPHLHEVFDWGGNGKVTGVLLHTKFLPDIGTRSTEEIHRRQHFENTDLYDDYHQALIQNPNLWHENATKFEGTKQLVDLGLMSKGPWV